MIEWTERPLSGLAKYINGYAFKPEHWTKDGLPIVRIEQLKNPDTEYDYCNIKIPDYNIIDNGDLIFSWSASLFLRIWQHGKAALNQHLFKVIPFDIVDKLFLKYILDYSIDELQKSSHGSTMQHITRKELDYFNVKIPLFKPTQSKIAQILSTIDKAIDQTKALIHKYQRIKTGLMQDLLTRGIDENGNIRTEETHKFKDSPLGRIPVEWDCLPINSFISYISYGFTNPMPETLEGPYMVTAADVNYGKILYDTCRRTSQEAFDSLLTKKSRPKISDLLITKDGTLGRVAIVDRTNVCINQSVAVLRPNESILVGFFKLLLESPFYQKLIMDDSGGSTIKHIYITKLVYMPLAVPKDTVEQDRLLAIFNKYNDLLLQEENTLTKLQRIKSGLMQDLLTGKVSVNHLIKEEPNEKN